MTAFLNHFVFEFKTGLRNSNNLLMNYLFPLGFYAMMGLIMTRIFPGFDQILIPAMVVFVTMASNILGLPTPLVEMREAGVFRSYKINGVPAVSILIIPVLSTIFHTLIVSAIIFLTAGPLFGGVAPAKTLPFVLITLLVAFNFGAIGALIGVISANSRATVLWSQHVDRWHDGPDQHAAESRPAIDCLAAQLTRHAGFSGTGIRATDDL
jgi:ABC-2 type transport system permease protein